MKKIFIILFVLGICQSALAVEPICNVPPLPGNLDSYTDEEGIYFDKLMEYYLPAATLEAQLKLMNITPKMKVPVLSSEMLDNMDPKYFKQYNKIAFELYSQIKNLKMDVVNKQLFDSELENKSLKKENTQLTIDTIGTQKYKELYNMLLEAVDKSISDNKKVEKKYVEKIRKLLDELSDTKFNLAPDEKINAAYVLTLSPIIEQYYYNNEKIGTEIAPGAMISMNLLRISKNVGVINAWGKYTYLTSRVNLNSNWNGFTTNEITYKNDIWGFGGDFELSISELAKFESLSWSFKLGFGYMQGYVKSLNLAIIDKEFSGNIIKIETDFYNFNKTFPFGVKIGANFNKYNTDLVYPQFQKEIYMEKPWIPSVYFGLNFNLLQVF
jgi:hypothetical protein